MTGMYKDINSVLKKTPELPKGKLFNESNSRSRIMLVAKEMGCDKELLLIFNRYDRLIRNCKNETEKKHIAILGISEINKCFILFCFLCKKSCIKIGVFI